MNRLPSADRYANGLIDAWPIDERLGLRSECEAFIKLINEDDKIKTFFTSPLFGYEKRLSICQDFVDKGIISAKFGTFVKIIIKNGRGFYIEDIMNSVLTELDHRDQVEVGIVYYVNPLSEEQKNKLVKILQKKLDVKVRLKYILEPSLIGGIKIFIQGKMFDGSVTSQSAALKAQVLGRK